jgi:hypothetical protein
VYRFHDDVGVGAVLRQAAFRAALLVLLAVDLVFLGLHVAHVWGEWREVETLFSDRRFSIEHEGGLGEGWEAVKTVLCVLALLDVARRTGQRAYAAAAFGFTVALIDNVFELHETGGTWLAAGLQDTARAFEAAPQALGEVAIFASLGLLIAAVLWLGFRRTARGHWPAAAVAAALLAALAAVGVGLDLLHAAVGGLRRAVDRGFGFMEDGGELLILSLAAAYAIGLRRHLATQPRAIRAGSARS